MKIPKDIDYSGTVFPENPNADKFGKQFARYIHKRYFKRPGKILDIGCGQGRYLIGFKKLGYTCYGIDRDIRSVKKCKSKGLKVINTDLGSNRLPFEENFFDYIFCKAVMEHLDEPALFLSDCRRILKNGGVLFIETPNWKNSHKNFYEDPTHKTPFTDTSLNRLLIMLKFKDISIMNFRNAPYVWRYSLWAFYFPFSIKTSIHAICKK